MIQVPTDGSYFASTNGCAQMQSPGCSSFSFVRRLNLDRNPEGAHVFLCSFHWNKEMQHRTWMNEKGVAEQWDVFDFYEANPAHKTLVVEEKVKVVENVPFYPVINFAVHGKDSTALYDVHFAFETGEKLSSSLWRQNTNVNDLRQDIEDTRDHMATIKRPYGLVAIFDEAESRDERGARYGFIEYVLESIMLNGRGVLKYA